MSKLDVSLKLLSSFQNSEIYKNLIIQLNKDFQMATISEEFSLNIEPSELVEKLYKIISTLYVNHFNKYSNLLYRIDVSEQSLKSISSSNLDDVIKQHIYLILKREWQKVYFRSKF